VKFVYLVIIYNTCLPLSGYHIRIN